MHTLLEGATKGYPDEDPDRKGNYRESLSLSEYLSDHEETVHRNTES
jgi:hypothetical protein